MSPYTREYDDEGQMVMYPNDWILNPYLVHSYRQRLDKTQTVFANLFAEIKLPLGFSYRVNFSNNFLWRRDYLYDPIETPRGLSNNGYGERANQHNYNWMVDNLLTWNQTIADIHRLDFTFLANVEKNQSTYEQQIAFNMEPTGVLGYHALQAGINTQLLNDDLVSTGNALMARINYSLMDRYMFTASIRRDGYSAFGEGRPYAYFPSVALAWVISEEDFYNIDLVNNLKIRGSWGSAGNRDIHPYAALARLSTIRYLYGTTPASGVYSSSMANHDLRWENTESVNLGIDFAFLNSRLNGSIEVYRQLTTDLLLDRSLPQISGYQSVMANLGELENRGIEMSFNSVNIVNPNINWRSSLIFSFNRNKILHLYGDMVDIKDEQGNVTGQREADDLTNQWFIGESLDRVWEYEYLGIWQVHEADQAAIYGKRPGDVKLKDVNESGYYTPLDDKIFLGYSKPQYRIGFRNDITFLRNFEFSAFIRADLGFLGMNNAYKNHGIGGGQFDRQNIYEFDYWTPDNPTAKYPRLSADISSPEYNVWKDRSFVRLQNVSLAYNIPSVYIQRFEIKSLRVFIDMHNALTLTSWDHYDPESGMTPMPKFVTFGLNLGL
jgi:TonB-dependent starch-binding outer membrane protein SusC